MSTDILRFAQDRFFQALIEELKALQADVGKLKRTEFLTKLTAGLNADTVDNFHAAATAAANVLLALNANAKLPASITGDADTVDGIHANTVAMANQLLALNADAKLPASITGDADTVDNVHGIGVFRIGRFKDSNNNVYQHSNVRIQYGVAPSSTTDITVTFPDAFTSVYVALAVSNYTNNVYAVQSLSTTGFTAKKISGSASAGVYWIAFGVI